jgi:methylene-tetrahydromethanopterin dehydrogenase
MNDDGVLIAGSKIYGIGAMAVGQLKYQTQHQLLKQLLAPVLSTESHQPENPSSENQQPQAVKYVEFSAAFKLARELLKRPS